MKLEIHSGVAITSQKQQLAQIDLAIAGARMRQKVSVSDAVGRAKRRLSEQQADHTIRVAAELAALEADGVANLDPRQRRVIESRQRMASWSYRPSIAVPFGQPTPQRAAHAPEGFEDILVSGAAVRGHPGSTRARVIVPMTTTHQIAAALAELKRENDLRGREWVELSRSLHVNGKGTLDRALLQRPHLRKALTVFIDDYRIVQERGPTISYYGQSRDLDWSPELGSIAQNRMWFVRHGNKHGAGAIAEVLMWHLDTFAVAMLNVSDAKVPTPHEIGMILADIKNRDDGRYVYIGYMLAAAQVLENAYGVWWTLCGRHRMERTKLFQREPLAI